MTVISVTQARKKLFSLLDEANNSHSPIFIEGKRGGAVLVGREDWATIEETLYITSIPGMRESIKKGLKTPLRRLKQSACERITNKNPHIKALSLDGKLLFP